MTGLMEEQAKLEGRRQPQKCLRWCRAESEDPAYSSIIILSWINCVMNRINPLFTEKKIYEFVLGKFNKCECVDQCCKMLKHLNQDISICFGCIYVL